MTAPQQPGQPSQPPSSIPPAGPIGGPAAPAYCVRHPDRQTALRCSRCDRPACPECLREASVGYQCVDCVKSGQKGVRRARPTAVSTASARRPVVTSVLVGLNVAMYALTAVIANSPIQNYQSTFFERLELVPVFVATGSWWEVVTSGFLHLGPLHIAMNMVALWVIGRSLEPMLGRTRFIVLYLLSMLGGSASVMLFASPFSGVAGASGAVFGLMGSLLVVALKLRQNPGSVISWIAINVVLSFAIPNISWVGHLGGLAAGMLFTALLLYTPRSSRLAWQVGSGLVVFVLLVAAIASRAFVLAPLVS